MKFRPVEGEFIHADKWTELQDEANSGFLLIVRRKRLELLRDHAIEPLESGFHPPAPLSSWNTLLLPSKKQPIIGAGEYQGFVYLTTQHSQDRHPCPRLNLNSQSQEAGGRRPVLLDCADTGIGYWRVVRYKIRTQCQLYAYFGLLNDAFGKYLASDGRWVVGDDPEKLWKTRGHGLSWNFP